MVDIVERIRNRLHDAPMETERLLDETADTIEALRTELRAIKRDFKAGRLILSPAFDKKLKSKQIAQADTRRA